ncbi:unnamed protein product [Sphagnum jensenii]|uniref:Trichome birefringence-like N-terminal domain-containing protein n=1 Tax=Sphagnum jensenii TaxID=128206 RepID=A0ABP1BPN1_9BRYO
MKLQKLHLLCLWVLAAVLPLALVRVYIFYNSPGLIPADFTSLFFKAHDGREPVQPAVWKVLITPKSRSTTTTSSTAESDASSSQQQLPADSDQNKNNSAIEESKTVDDDKTSHLLHSSSTQDRSQNHTSNEQPIWDHEMNNSKPVTDVKEQLELAKNMRTAAAHDVENVKDHAAVEDDNIAATQNDVVREEEGELVECSEVDLSKRVVQLDGSKKQLQVPEADRSDKCNKSRSSNETTAATSSTTTLPAVAAMKHSKMPASNLEAAAAGAAGAAKSTVCDLSNGTWVQDFGAALAYTNDTCKYITGHQNCMTNGRMDKEFLYWRWKPSTCELPQIDARTTLESLRGKSLVFVGDSIARNQFQSLLCILSQAEDPTHLYHDEDWRDHIYVFPSYSFTLSVRWSPYLVRQIEKEIPVMASGGDDDNNSTTTTQVMIAHLDLDLLEETWVQAVVGADIVVISSGQWWSKAGVYLEDGKIVGCHLCSPQLLPELKEEQQQQDPVHEEGAPHGDAGIVRKSIVGFHDAYRRALHNVLEGVLSIPGYKGITMFRSFAPDHFENGSWDSGGSCPRTVPGGVPFDSFTEKMYQIQIEEFHKLVSSHGSLLNESSSSNSSMSSQLGSKEEEDKNGLVAAVVTTSRLKLVDITNLAQIRADGHPNAYRMYQPFAKENVGRIQNDCLHWCLPGPIDVWNDVLMESLQQQQLLEGTKLR